MVIKIGAKIKVLRKSANVTQEKFADYLGITPQAISRWESENAYPDIEIIPSIANFFNVTTDELLGVDIQKKQEKLNEIYNLLKEKSSKGLMDDGITICRNAINEFPNDYKLLRELSAFLSGKSGMTENTEERQKYDKEAIAINERILEDCTDDEIRSSALLSLAYGYDNIGEKEKSEETAMKMPSFYCTRETVLANIYMIAIKR